MRARDNGLSLPAGLRDWRGDGRSFFALLGGEGRGQLGLRQGGCDRWTARRAKHRRGATDVERLLGRPLRETLPAMDVAPTTPDRATHRRRRLPCARKQVIEPDGSPHAECQGADAIRAAGVCAPYGYGVIRFSYRDIIGNIDGVLETVGQEPGAALASPQRNCPPRGAEAVQSGSGRLGKTPSMVGSTPSPPASPASLQRPAGATAARSTGSGCAFSLGDDRQARRGTRAPRDSRRA
jgi:very-short-patch-repair endonuclease